MTAALQLQQGQQRIGLESANVGLRAGELERGRMSDTVDALYKATAMRHTEAETKRLESGDADKTAEIRNYEYAKAHGYTGTVEQWKSVADTTSIKDYEYAVAKGFKGSFIDWKTELAKAQATQVNIGGAVEKHKAISQLKGQDYFNNPDWIDDVHKFTDSKESRRAISRAVSDEESKAKRKLTNEEWAEAEDRARIRRGLSYIEDKIETAGGKATKAKWTGDGSALVFTVTWKDGSSQQLRYTVR